MSTSPRRRCNSCTICLHCRQENIGLNIPGSICSCSSIHNACINCQNARFRIFSTNGRDSPPYRPPSQRSSPITVTNNTSLIPICGCGSTICDICRRSIPTATNSCNCTNGKKCMICRTDPPI